MRTLLVGLDNPHSTDPTMALFPRPIGATGDRIVKLIRSAVSPYPTHHYLSDFARCNLYATGRAATGRGRTAIDHQLAGHVLLLADALGAQNVVAFGRRVSEAFSPYCAMVPDYCKSIVIKFRDRPLELFTLPYPSGRNYWYNDEKNYEQAGAVLAGLRDRVVIPHREPSGPERFRQGLGELSS